MIDEVNGTKRNGLAPRTAGPLVRPLHPMTIGMLEQALLGRYPAADAEPWDRTGLTVGDPAKQLARVAIALDPSVGAIEEARARGANVLVTHHPAFLEAPDSFRPARSSMEASGAVVWTALVNDVALMSFHTSLDVSQDAAVVLPGLLGLEFKGIIDPLASDKQKGYGQLCAVSSNDEPLTLEHLAARCTSVFGRQCRVWGDFSREVSLIATCTGSSGDLAKRCQNIGVDCLVCGEVKYHDALAASQAGLAIIDLGHDTSELPLVAVLAVAIESVGVSKEQITSIDQGANWTYPETTRR